MKTALILYYTCSNNTKKIARLLERQLSDRNWSTERSSLVDFNPEQQSISPDLVVIGVPVHYWDIPDPALDKIKQLPRFENSYGFVFSTYGKCVCNEVPFFLAEALEQKGVSVLGGARVLMPHATRVDPENRLGDIDPEFGRGEPSKANLDQISSGFENILSLLEKSEPASFDINRLKQLHTRGKRAGIMNFFMSTNSRRSVMPDIEHNQEQCTSCAACAAACSNQAIIIYDGLIRLQHKQCAKCYKCMEICPSHALTIDYDKAVFWTKSIHPFASKTDTKVIT